MKEIDGVATLRVLELPHTANIAVHEHVALLLHTPPLVTLIGLIDIAISITQAYQQHRSIARPLEVGDDRHRPECILAGGRPGMPGRLAGIGAVIEARGHRRMVERLG